MDLIYALYENKMGTTEGKHYARVLPKDTVDLNTIIHDMKQLGAHGSEEALNHDINLMFRAIINRVADGFKVNTILAQYGLSIKGVFDSPADNFSPARHAVLPVTSPGPLLRQSIDGQIPVAKKESSHSAPRPQVAIDHTSQTTDQLITPGGLMEVQGYRLRFDAADQAQGVFLIEVESEAEVRAGVYARNNPKLLLFNAPTNLKPGSYRLEVRGKLLTNGVREIGLLPKLLTVNPA